MSLSFRTRGNFVDFVNIDNTSIHAETVIMSLHNTSKAIDWVYGEDTTRISFTIDEVEYNGVLVTDIDFDGTPMTTQADFETNIEAMFPNLAGGGGGLGYLVYTALLAQTGANAPTATILENTLGGTPVWTRPTSAGSYSMTLAGAFPAGKVYCAGFDLANGLVTMPISKLAMSDFYYAVYRASNDVLQVFFYDNTYSGVDMSATGIIQLCLPEIRVYP